MSNNPAAVGRARTAPSTSAVADNFFSLSDIVCQLSLKGVKREVMAAELQRRKKARSLHAVDATANLFGIDLGELEEEDTLVTSGRRQDGADGDETTQFAKGRVEGSAKARLQCKKLLQTLCYADKATDVIARALLDLAVDHCVEHSLRGATWDANN